MGSPGLRLEHRTCGTLSSVSLWLVAPDPGMFDNVRRGGAVSQPIVSPAAGSARYLVLLSGDVCYDQQHHLSTLAEAFENSDQRDVVVDLSGVRLLGSTGMTFLMVLARTCTRRTGALSLLAPDSFVRRTLEAVGFHREFAIVEV